MSLFSDLWARLSGKAATPPVIPAGPREQHQRFKYALVTLAHDHPDRYAANCSSQHAQAKLEAVWDEVGQMVSAEGRSSRVGLGIQVHGAPERPAIMVTLPPPERNNEAFQIFCAPRASTIAADGTLFIPDVIEGAMEFRV